MQTPWTSKVDPTAVLPEYPRPQMKRENYTVLNGLWDYAITENDQPPQTWDGKILVPFSPEAPLSGVNRTLQPGQHLWYRRNLSLKGKHLLHFGAVDQIAAVYLNGKLLGEHVGGYTAFTLEAELSGSDELLVRVKDDTDQSPLTRGKQKTDRGGIWYTPQSGIWQTVWAEPVPETYIDRLHIRPLYNKSAVAITLCSKADADCKVEFAGQTYEGKTNAPITVPVPNFRPWSPEDPFLYDFSAALGEDRVDSYFAMRKVEVKRDEKDIRRIFLNGKPYFMHGLLDQGYWPDGLYTAPTDDALILDIQSMKDMGFNTLRKHIKVEPMRWYYHCDRIGMLVWQDMPNGGEDYSLVTIGAPFITGIHRKDNAYKGFARQSEYGRQMFHQELKEMVTQLYSVPSIVMWVPFNEGWGQFDAKVAVKIIEELDADRLIDHASGWHDQGIGHFKSVHWYASAYRFQKDKKGRCVILTECGGFNLRVEEHSWNNKNFGYKKQKSDEKLLESYRKLILDQLVPAKKKGLSAVIYTQISDVEDEVNGIWTYDRQVQKLPTAAVRECNLQLTAGN